VLCPHCKAPNANDARFCGTCGKATASTEPVSFPNITGDGPPMIGREIAGRYRIQSKIGEGGMGAVYKAEQMSLKRAVAIKLLRSDVSGSPLLLRRFNAEAEAVAKLSHPNSVNIYDFGQDSDGTLFIAMEFIEGRSLRAVIQSEAPLPLARALTIASQVAASLADAHSHSIIHRDLKPDNVMLQSRGRARDIVRVLDFGIAKLRDDQRATQQAMTQAGDMLGTPQYMAPEQIRGDAIDGRTDIYAMGCMIYEMITGRLPFEGATIMALLSKHLTEQPVPPSQRRPDLAITPHVDQLVMAAMAKDVRQRPATMEQFGEQIAAVLRTVPPDPGQLSAVVGVAQPPINTPTPGGQFAAHAMPTPQVYSPPQGPPLTPPPAPHLGPPPGPMLSPPPGPMYPPIAGGGPPFSPPAPGPAPYGTPAQPGMYAAPRPGSSNKLVLWIVLGVLVLGGGGAAAYFATRSSTKAAAHEHHPNQPGDDEGSEEGDDEPEPGGGTAAGQTVEVGDGVKLVVPPGFTPQKVARGVMASDSRGIVISVTSISSPSQDPTELAELYAKATGLTLEGVSTTTVQGALRPVATFAGTVRGVAVRHIAVIYFGNGYKVAGVMQVPMTLTDDAGVRALADEVAEKRIVLP
jgi:eukaryotic-like serine/threonine-protein kinase